MGEQEDIQFESMPDFGSMFAPPPKEKRVEVPKEKVYNTLYDELEAKCRPERFFDASNLTKFNYANEIYAELRDRKGATDDELIELRDRAIKNLGIHISTHKLYEYLNRYFDPAIYSTMESYDAQRVADAGYYKSRMEQCKDDIQVLEQLREAAKEFIERRDEELRWEEGQQARIRKEQEDAEREIKMFLLFSIAILIITILLIIGVLNIK